jgi:hypothetical protein
MRMYNIVIAMSQLFVTQLLLFPAHMPVPHLNNADTLL